MHSMPPLNVSHLLLLDASFLAAQEMRIVAIVQIIKGKGFNRPHHPSLLKPILVKCLQLYKKVKELAVRLQLVKLLGVRGAEYQPISAHWGELSNSNCPKVEVVMKELVGESISEILEPCFGYRHYGGGSIFNPNALPNPIAIKVTRSVTITTSVSTGYDN